MPISPAAPQSRRAKFAEEYDLDFIIDGNNTLSYEDLLAYANGSDLRGDFGTSQNGLIEFSREFLTSLAESRDVEILPDEFQKKKSSANSPNADKRFFRDIGDLLDAVRYSTSRICIYTSGTMGRPKRVSHTIETLSRNIKVGIKHAKDKWGYCYAPSHMAGLQVLLQAFFNKNACVNLFGKTRDNIYSELSSRSITHISATPTFYRMLLPYEKQFPCVVRATFGGEKSSPQLYESVSRIFPCAKITNIYASTEAGALLASDADIFKIPPGMENLVVIDNGELLIHKSILPDSNNIPLSGDFYRTGDMVEFSDADKTSFRFSGRAGNSINVGGYKINPEEVEESIKSLDGVGDAIVFGKPNSLLGNILCAKIRLLPGARLSESEVRTSLAKILPQFKIPRIIDFTDSLQQTKTGKIKRL